MPRHKCATCGKKFDLKRYLTKHELRMHNNPKKSAEGEEPMDPLKCSMCDKVFPRLSHLQRHQMTHLNVRNWACEYCDEKFVQKAHLTRHVLRKHPQESGAEVTWFACDICGNLFKTAYEMRSHRSTVHNRFRCPKCEEIQEGNESLRKHQMKCRNESKVCSNCGASFSRLSELTAHRNSCLKKVAFVCTPCDEYFKQRVQLDRHIKKLHFRSSKCINCTYISESPIQNARHSLECLNVVICGYCNYPDPDEDHVAEQHWKRLKRAMTVNRARREAEEEKEREKQQEVVEEEKEADEDDVEDSEGRVVKEEVGSHLETSLGRTISEDSDDTHHRLLDNFAESTSSHLNFQSTAFGEDDKAAEEFLMFTICPKSTDLSFDLRGRLPARLAELFPVLEETSIVLLNSTESVAPRSTRMTVQVPVQIPKGGENEKEMRSWLEKTIVLAENLVKV